MDDELVPILSDEVAMEWKIAIAFATLAAGYIIAVGVALLMGKL